MKNFLWILFFTALLWGVSVQAAGFDCGKAATKAEKMICADPALSGLDSEMSQAYKNSVNTFNIGDGSDPGSEDLKKSQHDFLAARNACATAQCMTDLYQSRIAVLQFKGRPGASAWSDKIAGVYHHEKFMEMDVQVRDDTSVRIVITGAEPETASWICNLSGVGQKLPDDTVQIISDDKASKPVLTLNPAENKIIVPDTPLNQATSGEFCGNNGTLVFEYKRD